MWSSSDRIGKLCLRGRGSIVLFRSRFRLFAIRPGALPTSPNSPSAAAANPGHSAAASLNPRRKRRIRPLWQWLIASKIGSRTAGASSMPAMMEGQADAVMANLDPRVKANLVLGAESFTISSESGILSEQLAAMKQKSMVILKEYIIKHNAPNDVPDEPVDGESDDEGDALVKNPPKKSKKQK